ncbi:MAG: methionyl-tRNA formyltransferase [Armatimonadetes bacterium]|nr:methionyl-tRNA formyltransferase [Armatimonadota bacterium]
MKIVYFGTASFAVPALRQLAPHVRLVVSQPDRPTGRGLKMHSTPVSEVARELGIPLITPEKCRAPEVIEQIIAVEPDVNVVAAYGQILNQKLLDSALRGSVNLHGSILPKYRGAAPIQRAILLGETSTGVTLMQMDRGMDSGDIIAISETPILAEETYGALQDRLAEIAAELMKAWIERIVRGDYPREPQDHQAMTLAPKVDKGEARLDVSQPVHGEYNRWRAFTPSPGAFLDTKRGMLRIQEARLSGVVANHGTLVQSEGGWHLGFHDGSIQLITVQPAGKPQMSMRDYVNGARLQSGERLVEQS